MKVHYRRRWWVASVPSGSGGAAKEGESTSARERTMREGLGICWRGIRRGYADGTWRAGEGGRWVMWGRVMWQVIQTGIE